MLEIFTGAFCALLISLTVTPFIRWLSRRIGYVAHPRQDRWHQKPTALLGGVGIFLAFVIPFAALHQYDHGVLFVMAGATIVFALGVLDDLYQIQPNTKLVVQIAAAGLTTFGSLAIPSQGLALIVIPLAILWLVALTNAFNLLDNMDGLSAGTACIASFFLFVISYTMDDSNVALYSAILFGATLGFLFYNFHPATIFMGDSGSMFLGFTLAAYTMKGNWEQATNLVLMMFTPALVLAVPIFDTTFVTLVRWMNGRAISVGGRDHTSHRLVAFGLSERKAVSLFYLISIVCGFIAFLGVLYNALLPSILGTLVVIAIFYLGLFLNGIVTYGTESEVSRRAIADRGVVLDVFLMYKRRILEVLLSAVLICLAYVASFVIRYDGDIPSERFQELALSLPLVLSLKLVAFASCRLYRGVWRYFGMQDLMDILKAVTLSSVLALTAVTLVSPFIEIFSRSILVIDWMLLLLLVAGARLLIHIIREYLVGLSNARGKRVIIVGAGDAGELVLRELRNNARLGYIPVGFFDDNPDKQGRRIHGVPVIGGTSTIVEAVSRLGVDQIIVAIPSAQPESLEGIIRICESSGLPFTVMPSMADLFQTGVPTEVFQSRSGNFQSQLKKGGAAPIWH